jgi:hypothetical protein
MDLQLLCGLSMIATNNKSTSKHEPALFSSRDLSQQPITVLTQHWTIDDLQHLRMLA